MTTLGSVQLSDHLVLDGIENAPGIAWSQRRTVTGEPVVQVTPVSGGRKLTLSAENHLTLAQVQAIKEIEAAGQPVTMVHHRGSFQVLVVGVDVAPSIVHADPGPEDWYSGTITMIEV